MIATKTIAEEILELKRERRATLLAHHYQDAEIQELADVIGDSLELARKAKQFDGDVIAFCGVWFMAETAKVLNPERIVVVPDREAGCSLVDSCPAEQVRAYRQRHPETAIVSYINTSVEVKAESDILCTSRNAVKIVNSIPADQPILFLPDINLGNFVKRETGRENMKIWLVHRSRDVRRPPADASPDGAPFRPGSRPSGVSVRGSVDGRFYRLHIGHHRLLRFEPRRRVHRDHRPAAC